MSEEANPTEYPEIDRASMEVDIACVGFGPATGGFLSTLTKAWTENPADPAFESKVLRGALQVLCYERADDISSGVSGVVSRAQAIRASFPELNPTEIPMAGPVKSERVMYLLDPSAPAAVPLSYGPLILSSHRRTASRPQRPRLYAALDPGLPQQAWRAGALHRPVQPVGWLAVDGYRLVQIWPGTPVSALLINGKKVEGLRLADQGVDKTGAPTDGFMAGMDVKALLTVVGDGPVGAVGQALDDKFGLPEGHHKRESRYPSPADTAEWRSRDPSDRK